MSSTAYRNAHGVELKPGNWFLGADQYGQKEGIIVRVVQRGGIADTNGGPSVVYKTAPGERAVQTILADNVFQTLGPMIIEGDGTVKQNPIGSTVAVELYWFILNSVDLRHFFDRLGYDPRALSDWAAIAKTGAQMYATEHAERSQWDTIFPAAVRKETARLLFDRYVSDSHPIRANPLTRVKNPRKRLNKSDNPPDTYYSFSGGMWRLIQQGMPVNADTPDLERVRKVAAAYSLKPDSEFWDGDSGTWRPFANPLTRVKVKSPAQRGGAAPSERLTKRRKTTQKAPPGFYANPTPRLERADQESQREHFNPKTGKMTKRPTKRLKERRALTHYADTPGVWANPSTFLYAVFRMASDGTPAYFMRAYRTLKEAREYAQGLADKGGLSYGVIKKPL